MKNSVLLIVFTIICSVANAQRPGPPHNETTAYDDKKENPPMYQAEESTSHRKAQAELLEEFKVYPNPAKNSITIATGTDAPAKIELIDLTGKIILEIKNIDLTENKFTIDVSTLPRGIYIIRLDFEYIQLAKKTVLCE